MALGGHKFGGSYFIGGAAHSVVRFCAMPSYILGKCGKCGREKYCEKLVLGADTLSGELFCDCGAHGQLSVSLGFRKASSF